MPCTASSHVCTMRALSSTSVAPLARSCASGRCNTSCQRGCTSTRSSKPITFMARATAPTLPAWLVLSSMNRVCMWIRSAQRPVRQAMRPSMEGSVKRAQRQRMGAACASRCAFSHLAPVCPFAGHVRKPHPPVACPLRLPATHIQRWQNKGLGLFTLFLKDAVAIKKSLAKAHAANKVAPWQGEQ